jgi:small conductance mechanosensitive channel
MTFAQRLATSTLSVVEGLADRLPWIAMGLVFLLVAWWISRIVVRLVQAALARTSTAGHVDLLVARLAGMLTFVVGAIVALGIMGIQVGVLVTSLGLASLTIGFALRDVLANSVAGVLLLFQRPFTVGDAISAAGVEGVVRDLRVRDTLVEQADGRMVFIPNATVFNAVITNTSANHRRRVEVLVHIPAEDDLDAARVAALAGIARAKGLLDEPPAEARFVKCAGVSATLAVRRWVDCDDTPFAVAQDTAIAAVLGALRDAGIRVAAAE